MGNNEIMAFFCGAWITCGLAFFTLDLFATALRNAKYDGTASAVASATFGNLFAIGLTLMVMALKGF